MAGIVGQYTPSCHGRYCSRNSCGACFVSLPHSLPHIMSTFSFMPVSKCSLSLIADSQVLATYPLAVINFLPRNKIFEPSSPSSEDLSLQTSVDETAFWLKAFRNSLYPRSTGLGPIAKLC